MASPTVPTTLAELVRRYQVCWEVWPEYSVIGPMRQQVGFELELLGSDKSVGEYDPSCPKAAEIHATLEAVAQGILENDKQVRVQIDRSSQSLSYSPARGNRPDVTLSIKILHREGAENPVDEGERTYLEHAKAHLRHLGVCQHRWHSAEPDHGAVSVAA